MASKQRLIDASDLHAEIDILYQKHYVRSCDKTVHDIFDAIRRRINRAPTVDAVEVVHAHWVIEKRHSVSQNPYMDDNYHAHATCSHCGFIVDSRNLSFGYAELKTTKFCSECGAHMDEEVADV